MLNITTQGFLSWAVLNSERKITDCSEGRQPNLILDVGLDGIATKTWAASFEFCAFGDGTSEPVVSQTSLDSELSRSNVYAFEDDSQGTTLSGDVLILKRTFLSAPVESETTFTEIGLAAESTGDLFSRILLSSPAAIPAGSTLAIQYELYVHFDPANVPLRIDNPIDGLSMDGVLQFQYAGIASVDTVGTTVIYDNGDLCNEPSQAGNGFLSTDDAAPATFSNSVDRSLATNLEISVLLQSYTLGSFYRDKLVRLSPIEGLDVSWGSFGMGASTQPYKNTGLIYVASANFDKLGTYLNLTFRHSWGRWPSLNSPEAYRTLFYSLEEDASIFLKQNPLLTYFGLSID